MVITLEGAVKSKYHSIQDFAAAVGWNRHKAARIVKNPKSATAGEIEQICSVLNITDNETTMRLFFTKNATM